MVQTLIDYIPAYDRLEALFDRWYDRHPSHRPTLHLSRLALGRLPTAEKDLYRIPAELKTACIALCRADRTRQYKDIAAALGMTPSTVQKYANRAGLHRLHPKQPARPKKKTGVRGTYAQAETRAQRVSELHAQGLKQREIAAALGIRRHTVAYYLRPTCKARHRLATTTPQPAAA